MSIPALVERLRAIETDPNNAWVVSDSRDLDPAEVHEPADEVLLDALREAGYTAVADEYIRIREERCGGFWYE